MITYKKGTIFSSLFRIHGSALYRAVIPSFLSTGILLLLEYVTDYGPEDSDMSDWFSHPYPIMAFIGAFTFFLTFKCSYSYNRYWDACVNVHQMQSRWLDVGIQLAAFHLQSQRFSHILPPAFGEYPHIDHVVRKREVVQIRDQSTQLQRVLREQKGDDTATDGTSSLSDSSSTDIFDNQNSSSKMSQRTKKKKRSKMKSVSFSDTLSDGENENEVNFNVSGSIISTSDYHDLDSLPNRETNYSHGRSGTKMSSNRKRHTANDESGCLKCSPDLSGGMAKTGSPSLFLLEASHLLSLLSAVSLHTLRNDIDTDVYSFKAYNAGSPFPLWDPDADNNRRHNAFKSIEYLFGTARTPAKRIAYNAHRPFIVMGGVSDAEIELLQRARGPVAKVTLCSLWLHEFIAREYSKGSLGDVSAPIVSRIFQFLSDGMVGYNQARRIGHIPFPFPHHQFTKFFLMIVTCLMPVLMLAFVSEIYVAVILNMMSVGVLYGLWLVAKELEDPFKAIPNELPLNFFQAQHNEALVVLFSGFHPEAYWNIDNQEKNLDEC